MWFEKYMILTRGFQNVREGGRVAGFQIKTRIVYYRGVFLPLVSRTDVTIDGEKFPAESIRYKLGDRTFTQEEAAKAYDVRWDFGVPLTVIVSKSGGLKPGPHDVEVYQVISTDYGGDRTGSAKKRITLVA
jgi:hypothetical protein